MGEVKKCVVWDLDNTVWEGVCLEGPVRLRPEVRQTLEELDCRGILHSIASRGDADTALQVLQNYKLTDYFLVPQINWQQKSANVVKIAEELGIALDAMAFVDDDVFEREQLSFMLPEVLTIDAGQVGELPQMAAFSPATLTQESRSRRLFYRAEQQRKQNEKQYPTREEFLKSCRMRLTVRRMKEADFPRVLELMSRTHQLNTTGKIFDPQELREMLQDKSGSVVVHVADLEDRFGSYGTIGVAIVISGVQPWRLIYLAISCRVLGRGIERAFLARLTEDARRHGLNTVEAAFRDTGRNKMMRSLYQMMGFRHRDSLTENGTLIFSARTDKIPAAPRWVEVL
jgi:FkbH-like protein